MKIPLSCSSRSASEVETSNPDSPLSDESRTPQLVPITHGDDRLSISARCNDETQSRRLRILVVEDEPSVRQVLVEYLEGESFDVEMAAEGIEGLQKFCDGHFDVVVTDRSMPKLCGDDLAAIIKTFQSARPVILIGVLSTDGCGECSPSAANYTLGKPFALADLRRAIDWVTTPSSLAGVEVS